MIILYNNNSLLLLYLKICLSYKCILNESIVHFGRESALSPKLIFTIKLLQGIYVRSQITVVRFYNIDDKLIA